MNCFSQDPNFFFFWHNLQQDLRHLVCFQAAVSWKWSWCCCGSTTCTSSTWRRPRGRWTPASGPPGWRWPWKAATTSYTTSAARRGSPSQAPTAPRSSAASGTLCRGSGQTRNPPFWRAMVNHFHPCSINQTDQMLVHLQSFNSVPENYTIPESTKNGVPLFYIPPGSTTPVSATTLETTFTLHVH